MDICPFCSAKTLVKGRIDVDLATLEPIKQLYCHTCGFKGTIKPERLQDIASLGGVVSADGQVIPLG